MARANLVRSFTGIVVLIFLTIGSLGHASEEASTASLQDMNKWAADQIARWSPPGKSQYKYAIETEEEALARYESIASDAFEVAFDPTEEPLFKGPLGRIRTASLLLAVARSESSFRKDVDTGEGPQAKGDGGQSWCLMQIKLGKAVSGKTPLRISFNNGVVSYTKNPSDLGGEDLVSDRKACFRAGLRIMRNSFGSCRGLPTEERLSAYTSGNCKNGRDSSRARVSVAMKWLSTNPPPMNDSAVMGLLHPEKASESK